MNIRKKIGIFLAARSGSKRLPNKHFLKLSSDLKVIDLCILRLKKIKLIKNNIYLCTTNNKNDDKFKLVCKEHKINLYRGSEKDVLKRIINCANKFGVKTIVRITADCPIIDPNLVDKCIYLHLKEKNDYTSNIMKLTFPDGLDVEIIELKSLTKSYKISNSAYNKEHVTPFIRSSKFFKKKNLRSSINYSNRRWTLDYYKDYIFIKKVVQFFSPNIYFSWKDIISSEKKNKKLFNIKKR